MQPFFDLDKLHKKQNKQRWFRLSIVGAILLIATVIGVAIVDNKHPIEHLATVSYGTVPTSSTPQNSPAITTQPPSTNALSQEEAQAKAQAAQDEVDAERDIANAENEQQTLNSELPPASGSSVTPISLPSIPTTPPATSCTYPSDLSSLSSRYLQAEGAVNGFENQINTPGGVGSYGMSGAALQNYEQQQLSTLETAAINAYNAWTAAEAQVHC